MAKHSPGPWVVDDRSGYLMITCAENHYVATVSGAISNKQAVADARLIAAAPELLAALKGDHWAHGDGSPGCATCALIKLIEGEDGQG